MAGVLYYLAGFSTTGRLRVSFGHFGAKVRHRESFFF